MICNSDTKKPKEKYHQELFLNWILTANRGKNMISLKKCNIKAKLWTIKLFKHSGYYGALFHLTVHQQHVDQFKQNIKIKWVHYDLILLL